MSPAHRTANSIACAYVLAKNEIRNIGDCLAALRTANIPTIVLDSGSTDGTIETVAGREQCTLESYSYRGHCVAYNELTSRHSRAEIVLILDADMRVNASLIDEIEIAFAKDPSLQVGIAPIAMLWDGLPLRHASLCPPKWIAFRGGAEYFEPVGHGEKLREGTRTGIVRSTLQHDDRKPYAQTLATQWRYARDLSNRARQSRLTWRDRIRVRTPLMILLTPLYSLIVKRGLLDGRAGIIYALDRLIYEALAYRAALSPQVKDEQQTVSTHGSQTALRAATDIKLPSGNRVI